jgi:hypothetical protein
MLWAQDLLEAIGVRAEGGDDEEEKAIAFPGPDSEAHRSS